MSDAKTLLEQYKSDIVPNISDSIILSSTKIFFVENRVFGTKSNNVVLIGAVR